jgi:acylpyruvate hydrolase
VRLVSYYADAGAPGGVLLDDEIVPLGAIGVADGSVRGALAELGEVGLESIVDRARSSAQRLRLDSVRLAPPVPDPQKIVCLGLNYSDHAAESGQEPPAAPLWFAKFANSLIGAHEPVVLPAAHPDYVDYEAELAVVIGRAAHRVKEADALSHVAGAMAFNDVSARDLQLQNPLWTSGKAIDTFAPCGPALVTVEEIGDVQDLALRTRIDGELLQEGSTREMIFGIAESVSWLSRTMTLLPGDIIATGTPAGVGASKGRFLRAGETVEVEVEGVGAIANPVREEPATP